MDRDEARFAQASREMLESGDYIIPSIQGKPRLNKPPLIYWMQAASVQSLTGGDVPHDEAWMYRLPSLLAAIVTVLATRRLGQSMFGPLAGFLGGCIIAICPVMFWEARQGRSDMVMVAFTTVALLGLWRCIKASGLLEAGKAEDRTAIPPATSAPPRVPHVTALSLWLPLALGVLTKGPITLLVIGLTIASLCVCVRRWRWTLALRPVLGLAVIVVVVAPWVAAVAYRHGAANYLHVLADETVGRSLTSKEGHSGFPGIHTLLMPLLLFPGSLMVGAGLRSAIAREFPRLRQRTAESLIITPQLFLLCGIIPAWIFFELVSTRLPHYTMPLYPLLAILAAQACCIAPTSLAGLLKMSPFRWALTLWLVALPVLILLAAATLALALRGITGVGVGICGLGVAAACTGLAAKALRLGDVPRLQLTGIAAFIPCLAAVAIALPQFDALWISRALGSHLRHLDPGRRLPIAAVGSSSIHGAGFQEDSLTFELRGSVDRIDPDQLDPWLKAHPGGLAIVPAHMMLGNHAVIPLAEVRGFNYSKGQLTYLCIMEARP